MAVAVTALHHLACQHAHNAACMQTREDAQRAKEDLNNVMLHDNELKIGWGKGVAIPSAPLYTSTEPSAGTGGASRSVVGASVPPPGLAGLPEAMPWALQPIASGPEPSDTGELQHAPAVCALFHLLRKLPRYDCLQVRACAAWQSHCTSSVYQEVCLS